MAGAWINKKVLIVVRTYPVPAHKNIEVSCTAGVTDDGKWVRLFPVPYRFLDDDKRFKKYQWIHVDTVKAPGDNRPESFKLNVDSIQIGDTVSTADGWRARKAILQPLMRSSMCQIQAERDLNKHPTLGIFRPAQITRLVLEPTESEWTRQQLDDLRQQDMFNKAPPGALEKLPYNFKYEYRCTDPACRGHSMTCFDWEVGQSFRKWRKEYGAQWEDKFRQRYEVEMINKNDTHFFVGNMHQHQGAWIIVGLFYPPKPAMGDLFGA